MPIYLAEAYGTKSLARAAVLVEPTSSDSLERQIQTWVLSGNLAYFAGRYAEALSNYLTAWGHLPMLVLPVFPPILGKIDPLVLTKVDLVDPLLQASAALHRLRPVLGGSAAIMPAIDPPSELADLTERFGGEAGKARRAQSLSLTLLQQGEFDLANRYADEARQSGDEAEQADAEAIRAAIALASGDAESARGGFAGAAERYRALARPDLEASMEHNLGVAGSLAGDAENAAVRFGAAINRMPAALGWSVTQALNPGSASVTRPAGNLGLPLVLRCGADWLPVPIRTIAPIARIDVARKGGAITVDLSNDAAAGLEEAFFKPRIDTARLSDLGIDLTDPVLFVTYLTQVRGFTLPLALGDTYHALGRFDLAAHYYLMAREYRYLNLTIERPMLWARLARTYLAEGDRLYRQQDPDGARQCYERIVKMGDEGFTVDSPLYAGAFAPLIDETLGLLNAPDPLAFDIVDYTRRLLVLQALANLQQIAQGINYLGFSEALVPIHPWRYLQNQARYFTNQAIQAERAFLTFKGTAEKEAFTRLTLEQSVDAQNSAVNVEKQKVKLAQEQEKVAGETADVAARRIEQAQASRDDYADVSAQTAFYDEITALYAAPDGGVHIDPDYAAQLGISLTYVHERYTGITGTSDFYYTEDVSKSEILRTMNRSRGKATRDLELRDMDRKIDQLGDDLSIAQAQKKAAKQGVTAAKAQQQLAQLRADQAKSQLDAFEDQELTPELWDNLAEAQRDLSRRYLDRAIGAAFLMERAYEFEYDTTVNRIRFDYTRSDLGGLMAGDLLLSDIDQFSYDRLLETDKKAPIKVSLALADRYPFQFRRGFRKTGRLDFQTALDDFDRWNPGTCCRKLRRVEVVIEGLVGADGLHGTLTNSGISVDRRRDGKIFTRVQKPETMILSRFDLRGDGFVFAATEEQVLAVFENSGVAGGWVLDLPPDLNDVDYETITNVHLVLYYDAYYSAQAASVVRAELAAAGREEQMLGLALRFQFPDAFFNFQATGELPFTLDHAYLPFHQTAPSVLDFVVHLETVDGTSPAGLVLDVSVDGSAFTATTDANGMAGSLDAAPGAAGGLAGLRGRPLAGDWAVKIDRAANEAAFTAGFTWAKVRNMAVFANYAYTPRGKALAQRRFDADPLAAFDRIDDPAASDGGPAVWAYDAATRTVAQQSALHAAAWLDAGPNKPGAMLLAKADADWPLRRDVVVRTRLASDRDGIGVVFRYQDPDNYYYFLMDAAHGLRRFGRKVAGVFADLDVPAVDTTAAYTPGRTYLLSVAAIDNVLVATLDGVVVLSGRDGAIGTGGRIGLLAWNNPTARFFDLLARDA